MPSLLNESQRDSEGEAKRLLSPSSVPGLGTSGNAAESMQDARNRQAGSSTPGALQDGGGGAASCWPAPLHAFWNNGVLVAVVSSMFFALAAALVKTPLIQGRIPVFEIVVIRAAVSTLVTSVSARANGIPMLGRTAPQWLLITRGVVGGTAMTASYEALVRLPLADSTVIFYACPAITAVLAWLLLGERFTWLIAAGCAASMAGVVLVAQPPWLVGGPAMEWGGQRLLGMAFGFAGAALAAGAYTCIRLIGKREHPLTIAMYFHIFSFASSALPLSLGYTHPTVLPSPAQAALLLGIACGSFGGNLLVNRSFQLQPAARASAINFCQVIFAYLLGSLFFNDPITLLGVCGTALIAAGMVVVNLEKLMGQHPAGTAGQGSNSGSDGANGAGGGGADPQEENVPGPWWQRLWAWREGHVPLKAKLSDVEAELGRLPGAGVHRYERIDGAGKLPQ